MFTNTGQFLLFTAHSASDGNTRRNTSHYLLVFLPKQSSQSNIITTVVVCTCCACLPANLHAAALRCRTAHGEQLSMRRRCFGSHHPAGNR